MWSVLVAALAAVGFILLTPTPAAAQCIPTDPGLLQLPPEMIGWYLYWTYGPGIFDAAAAAGVTTWDEFMIWFLGQVCAG